LTGKFDTTLDLSPGLKEYVSYSIKNLVKLQSGEYIALERLESTYKSCNLVSHLCVHATPDATQPIAIIVPHEVHLRAALPDEDPQISLADLCAKPKVKALVLKECNAAGKKSGFKGVEMLQGVVLTVDEWTPESGLVTAAQKIQRKKIAQRYDDQIKVRFSLPLLVDPNHQPEDTSQEAYTHK
jgi:long-chain acyl-CoA synthetase